MYKALSGSISSDTGIPDEYAVVKMAERFNKLPHEIRAMPEEDYQLCLLIWSAEAQANELKANQRGHYKK